MVVVGVGRGGDSGGGGGGGEKGLRVVRALLIIPSGQIYRKCPRLGCQWTNRTLVKEEKSFIGVLRTLPLPRVTSGSSIGSLRRS